MAAKKAPAKTPAKAPAKAPVKATTKVVTAKAPVKVTAKKTTATPATKAVPEVKKAKVYKERYSKTQLLNHLAESAELSRKQVSTVLDELTSIIEGHISKKGCGEFLLPGLMKIVTVKKPARKARKGINPFTGLETTFAAKPASVQVKVRPLKKMKEMAE